ncbi:hypothetical protein RSOLAG1IB_12671 [Rhizoctonia solani AG-1 IB]|uniref:Uncharacterized protein n=1 Tax=Thanatephorus cucumeris (strain AG1-IB / isolate 7/3/14) TaxID=1108050 RepID=A0A0B7G307_THACB|nr:hypothetical protein RSOLAG1IB_12671 [Rhizoctonia solani AG-1 IB]
MIWVTALRYENENKQYGPRGDKLHAGNLRISRQSSMQLLEAGKPIYRYFPHTIHRANKSAWLWNYCNCKRFADFACYDFNVASSLHAAINLPTNPIVSCFLL